MLILGLILAIFRRTSQKPEKLPNSSLSGRGNLLGDMGILIFLLLLAVGGFLSEAARLGADQPQFAAFSWIGYTLSKALSSDTWIAIKPVIWWFHAITSLLFIAVFPMTKMFHAFVVFLNIAFTDQGKGDFFDLCMSRICCPILTQTLRIFLWVWEMSWISHGSSYLTVHLAPNAHDVQRFALQLRRVSLSLR